MAKQVSSRKNNSIKSSATGKGSRGRKTTGRSSRGTSSNAKTSRNVKQEVKDYEDLMALQTVVTLAAAFVVSLFLFLSFLGFCGKIGNAIQGALFFVFGWCTWLIPFFLFFGMIFYLANRESPLAIVKLISAILTVFFLNCITALVGGSRESSGVICKWLSDALQKALGTAGTGVVFVAGLLISFLILFGRRILAGLREYNAYRDEMDDIYEEEKQKEDYVKPSYALRRQKQRDKKKFVHIDIKENAKKLDEKQAASAEEEKTGNKAAAKKKATAKGMTEIKPEKDFAELTIHHAGEQTEPDKPIYQTEIENKFGKTDLLPDSGALISEEPVMLQETGMEIIPEALPEQEKPASTKRKKQKETETLIEQSQTIAGTENRAVADNRSTTTVENKDTTFVENKSAIVNNAGTKQEEVYHVPPIELLKPSKAGNGATSDAELKMNAVKLQQTLESFGVKVKMGTVTCGPTVTRYEILPEQGVKVSKITSLADDLKLSLATANIRIEAPIPGKSAVGIEVPNEVPSPVSLRDLIDTDIFRKYDSNVAFAVGKDIAGKIIVTDIAKMPHLLIAGATGSGKSVCINTLIMSIIYKADPRDVKLIMIDPKVVELSVYNGIPHLFIPVVTDPKKASAALNWAVMEMMERYNKFAEIGVRNIIGYNERIQNAPNPEEEGYEKMSQLVIIVDELADLMMVASKEVEDAICRLAQLARAAGIHLIIATQRPSVNVITGTIKANIPSRIAFSVSSAIDSRTILDGGGAEKLLGKGDMLFFPSGYSEPVRLQGAFVSDEEVSDVVEYLKSNHETSYNEEITDKVTTAVAQTEGTADADGKEQSDKDEYFYDAGRFIIESDKASVGMLQRKFSVGFNRAARIMDQLCEAGIVGPAEGTKPRQILVTLEEFEQSIGNSVAEERQAEEF